MRPRLLMLTQWFNPEGSSFKGLALAKAFESAGFDVEVLTGFPNYPGGKVFPGYRIRPLQREVMDGIRVTRVPLYPSHSASKVGRVANYLSFTLSSAIYGCLLARRPDVMYVYHPPLTVGISATVIRALRRVPMLYDVNDMWPDTLSATGMVRSGLALRVIGSICTWVYRSADAINVVSPGFRRLLLERGIPDERISVVYNWAPESSEDSSSDEEPLRVSEPDRFRVLFAGNLGAAQGLDTVLDAAELLRDSCPQALFCILGDGIETKRLYAEIDRRRLSNVRMLPRVSPAEATQHLKAADVLLVHLRDDPLFTITIPSKTQAYLAVGRPIIMGVRGDAADLIVRSGAGLVIPPESPAELAGAVERLSSMPRSERESMGIAGRTFYEQILSSRVGMSAFADVLHGLNRSQTPHHASR